MNAERHAVLSSVACQSIHCSTRALGGRVRQEIAAPLPRGEIAADRVRLPQHQLAIDQDRHEPVGVEREQLRQVLRS
jgi:hypothetical protein